MDEGYSIKDFLSPFLVHIKLIILFSVLGVILGYSISKNYLPREYASDITMYVQSYTDIDELTDNINNINYSKQLVNTYIEVLKDKAVMDEVGKQLSKEFDRNILAWTFPLNANDEIPGASIRDCLNITTVPDTSAINVTVIAKHPEVASAICNILIEIAPPFMERAVGVGSINTIGQAQTNYSPVSPNILKNTMVGGTAGFMFIVFIIFMLDFFDNTIKDSDVLRNMYKKAIIGEIQQFGENNLSKKLLHGEADYFKLTDEDLPFSVVESYKSIRTNITFSLSTVDSNIIAVSSANIGDGKSTTSANIAIAKAQSGNKVLLIDADMRKPVQHKIFDLTNKQGLSTAAGKMDLLDNCIHKNVMENLDVMTAGPIPPNPSELLASRQTAKILNELSSQYSVIIIDTPPVNVVTDALELANSISGVIMVVRYGFTTNEDMKEASKRLEFAHMNMFGFILNGIKHPKQDMYFSGFNYGRRLYYKKNYGYSYGYRYSGKKKETELKPNVKTSQ